MVIPALQMQPKVIRKLRPYYTYMHLCSATSKDRAFKKTGFDSTLISHETVRVLRLKHTEKDTHTQKKKFIWTSTSTLKSMIHQIITLAIWGGHCKGEALRSSSIYHNMMIHFPEQLTLGRARGARGFRLVSFGFLTCVWFLERKLKTLSSF